MKPRSIVLSTSLVAGLAALGACGARTDLGPEASAGVTSASAGSVTGSGGGAGGSAPAGPGGGSVTSSDSASSSGAGGSCPDGGGVVLGVAAIPETKVLPQVRAQLVPLDDGAQKVALAFGIDPAADPPFDGVSPVWSVSVAPFGGWPPVFGPVGESLSQGGTTFVAGRADAPGTLDIGIAGEGEGAGEVVFGFDIPVAKSTPVGGGMGLGASGAPLFFAPGSNAGALGGMDVELDGHPHRFAYFDFEELYVVSQKSVACADASIHAAAVRLGDGFLVAQGSSLPFPGCAESDGPDGPATRLEVLVVTAGNPALTDVAIGSETITGVGLAARSDGAWVLSQRQGQSKTTEPVVAQRIDATGKLAGSPFDAVAPGHASAFTVTEAGDGFAVAWVESEGTGAIHVAVFAPDGGKRYEGALDPKPGFGVPTGPLSVVAKPDGEGVIAAIFPDENGASGGVGLLRFGPCGGQ